MKAEHSTLCEVAQKVRSTLPKYVDGYCAKASYAVHQALQSEGIQSTFLVSEDDYFSHVFLKVRDVEGHGDMLIDVTAAQFDRDMDVEIRALAGLNTSHFYWWSNPNEVKSPEELLRLQAEAEWPVKQMICLGVESLGVESLGFESRVESLTQEKE